MQFFVDLLFVYIFFFPQNFKQQQDSRTQKWILLWIVYFGKTVSTIIIFPFPLVIYMSTNVLMFTSTFFLL